jgi:hypothetical protein
MYFHSPSKKKKFLGNPVQFPVLRNVLQLPTAFVLIAISGHALFRVLEDIDPWKTGDTHILRGLQSASEIYRLSDRHWSANFSVHFCG